jgi:hypothetical protein
MAVSNGFRQSYKTAPVIITTGASNESATLTAGFWKMGVSGSVANIRFSGTFATLTKGTSTAQIDFTAVAPQIAGTLINITALTASGSLPLSVTTTYTPTNIPYTEIDIVIQLGSSSTSNQVASAINGDPKASGLVVATGHGSGAVVAFSKTALALPAATSTDPLYPIGVEDLPIYREGTVNALGTSTAGQVFFVKYDPC